MSYIDILFENDDILAFRDINPQAPVHFLVIPKKEIQTINDIQDDDKNLVGELFIIAKELVEGNVECALVKYKPSKTEAPGRYKFIGLANELKSVRPTPAGAVPCAILYG